MFNKYYYAYLILWGETSRHEEIAGELVVPGGGNVDGVVTGGERGDIDGAAAHFGVGEYHSVPVVNDGHIIGGINIIHDSDNA